MKRNVRVSIIGGSGYAGGELLRILLFHPDVTIHQVTSRQFVGEQVSRAHPNLRRVTSLTFCRMEDLVPCDVLFIALPNGVSMGYMHDVMLKAKYVIDLGADFRLKDQNIFDRWYHAGHQAPSLLPRFVSGLAELHRKELSKARLVACAGCEATVSILTLYPLVKHGLIRGDQIIIDAKMSSSQGGNTPGLASHHPERHGVVRSYRPTDHRHSAEIEQELSLYDKSIRVSVSATTIEMVRGLLVTIHTVPRGEITEKDLWQVYREEYQNEPFVRIIKEREGIYRYPEPKLLTGTNYCDIGFA
ncbi:N-acetyl-gamma-glutamyl-phosphate reductase, partial [Candidatus Gottesmanbacteria bacterium]|nr:N-acetyl-gamma-glutamyl-phosphate reductase [Candidatus Gottesmanbacteria bacterium]